LHTILHGERVRTNKKSGSKAAMFQLSTALLGYGSKIHNEQKKLCNCIKECSWHFLYNNILSDKK
jgi:hypothetical protein